MLKWRDQCIGISIEEAMWRRSSSSSISSLSGGMTWRDGDNDIGGVAKAMTGSNIHGERQWRKAAISSESVSQRFESRNS